MKTLIVSTEELAAHPEWRVFDCRAELTDPDAGPRAYAAGHIPGALHAHLELDLSGAKTGRNGRHPLPRAEDFIRWLGRTGLRAEDQVVAYDSAGTSYAARLWWLLQWVGHRAVAVLDGGFDKWMREGRPVTRDVPSFVSTVYSATPDDSLWIDSDQVLRDLDTRERLMVDARGAGRYAGIGETIDPVAGHIPGARNRPYTDNLAADGSFKPAHVLRRELEAIIAGYRPSQVVNLCGSGVTACHNILAMNIAGLDGGLLYPGSWSEWISDPSRAIATGSKP
ncbi:MAG TPA: sulfurtransferase [Casimicrobiaceae bacterium]|nr:sulfurtransferase [Casimicrobiaceae bacterium]